MSDQDKNDITLPELSGEKGWTELKIPDSYGNGRAFITGDRSDDRIKGRYFQKDSDNSFIARVWFGPATEGPTGFVHGGSMAAVLDEVMGISAWIRGYTVVAARITVAYRKMLPLGTVTTIEAKVKSINGKKVITKGKIYNETGTVFTESEGLYINIPPERFGEMIKYRDAFQKLKNTKDESD
ncbi:MAG: PaaI family thioesterase [Bacteroidales bacterium]|nr:PaaI family thioesterase [Bacteroidales bacterium]